MGTLGYIAKLDGTRELFALNKQYQWGGDALRVFGFLEGESHCALAHWFPQPSQVVEAIQRDYAQDHSGENVERLRDWHTRIADRLTRWAGDAPLAFLTEHDLEEFHPIPYEAHKLLITGSAHDSDYREDGVTYKTGSAW